VWFLVSTVSRPSTEVGGGSIAPVPRAHSGFRIAQSSRSTRGDIPPLLRKARQYWFFCRLSVVESRRVLIAPFIPLRGPFGPSLLAQLLRPLLTSGSRSPEVSSTAFDAQPLDLHSVPLMDWGFAATCQLARTPPASYPVLVHRLASLLRASFRPRLAASVISPLRFAITSRPSRCEGRGRDAS
jgi:hypothetical protein